MARYGRRHRRKSVSRPRRGSYSRPSRPRGEAPMPRSRGGFRMFVRRNLRWILAGALVVIVGVIALVLFLPGNAPGNGEQSANAANVPAEQQTPPEAEGEIGEFDEESEYSLDNVDEEMLAGLEGSDDSLFTAVDDEMADALFAEAGLRIGVTIGKLKNDADEVLLSKLEAASSMAKASKRIYEVYYYNAHGDYNQQVQDVRSLIKNNVDVIIIGATEKTQFDMVVAMASAQDIPVVTYNAPQSAGYAINVVADDADWGKTYGDFMAQTLPSGNVMNFFGNEESTIDMARTGAILSALGANPAIDVAKTVYAKWDGEAAGKAMETYLKTNSAPDGIICEEDMAKDVLQACIDAGKLPKVMCADATAGFIKLWHALRNTGVDVTPEPSPGATPSPSATPVMLTVDENELILIAQPAPVTIGAVAFEIAVWLAEGRQLKTNGLTYVYKTETLITEDTLIDYYVTIQNQPDSFVVRDIASAATLEALFLPASETQEG